MTDPQPGARTAADVHGSPEVALALLDRLDDAAAGLAPRCAGGVRFLGCGSSHLGGGLASHLLRTLAGTPAEAVVASEAAFYPPGPPSAPLAVALSRSGATSETLAAVQAHRDAGGGPVVALVCDAASQLAAAADHVVAVPEAGEDVVAQTRSVATFLAFSVLLAGRAAGLSPAPVVRRTLEQLAAERAPRAKTAARTAAAVAGGRLVLLGGGARWWLARETALKCMEMARVTATVERLMEYPHGPVEALDLSCTVVALRTAAAGHVEGPVLDRLETLCAGVVRMGGDRVCDPLGDAARLLGELHDGHLLALALARELGVDADAPVQIVSHITLGDP